MQLELICKVNDFNTNILSFDNKKLEFFPFLLSRSWLQQICVVQVNCSFDFLPLLSLFTSRSRRWDNFFEIYIFTLANKVTRTHFSFLHII